MALYCHPEKLHQSIKHTAGRLILMSTPVVHFPRCEMGQMIIAAVITDTASLNLMKLNFLQQDAAIKKKPKTKSKVSELSCVLNRFHTAAAWL